MVKQCICNGEVTGSNPGKGNMQHPKQGHVAAAALCTLRVSNAALSGTLASVEFGLPNVLSRFHLCPVFGLLLAMNSRSALALVPLPQRLPAPCD